MKALISAKLDCSSTSNSSNVILQSQASLSNSLNNAIEICHEQFGGMREYAVSLQLLMERLRTEKSYLDLLKETELRYEQSIKVLQNNYIELDNGWKIKYHELEHSSKLKYDQYVLESEAKYAQLLESTTIAYAELKAAYEKAK